jgi:hypothetical protein
MIARPREGTPEEGYLLEILGAGITVRRGLARRLLKPIIFI